MNAKETKNNTTKNKQKDEQRQKKEKKERVRAQVSREYCFMQSGMLIDKQLTSISHEVQHLCGRESIRARVFCHLESRSSDALAGAKTTHRFAISITRRAVQVNTRIGNTAKKLHSMQRCTSPERYQTGAPTVEVVTRDGSRAGNDGGPCKNRTYDQRNKSPLLYRLR